MITDFIHCVGASQGTVDIEPVVDIHDQELDGVSISYGETKEIYTNFFSFIHNNGVYILCC